MVWMITIPVVADIPVTYRPVTAQADKEIFAVVVRIYIPKCEPWSSTIAHPIMIPGPYRLAAYPATVISVCMVIVITVSYQIGPVVVYNARRPYCCVTVNTGSITSLDTVYCCLVVYNGCLLLWNDLS
jgi:hypothetical protein